MSTKRLFLTAEWSENRIFQRLCWLQPSLARLLIDEETASWIIFLDGRYAESNLSVRTWRDIQKVAVSWKIEDRLPAYITKQDTLLLQESLPYGIYKKMTSRLPAHVSRLWFDSHNRSKQQRLIKSSEDIKLVQAVCALTHELREWLNPQIQSWCLIGKTELQVRWELIQQAFLLWAEAEAFEVIVATWAHSALPHHQSSSTEISAWPILIDMWRRLNGWCSDSTRSFWIGEVDEWLYESRQKVHAIVQTAHDKAIECITPWTAANEIANIARSHIQESWYGNYYPHSLWHGVGVDIHEAPYVSVRSEDVLEPWMIITIEPGIYLPGEFGVRIEDMVVCSKKWALIL